MGRPPTKNKSFENRKKGLLKKISELSTLCGVEACMLIYPPKESNHLPIDPVIWPPRNPSEVKKILNRYKHAMKDLNPRKSSKKYEQNLSDFFDENDAIINDLSNDQLRGVLSTVDSKLELINKRIESIREKQNQSSLEGGETIGSNILMSTSGVEGDDYSNFNFDGFSTSYLSHTPRVVYSSSMGSELIEVIEPISTLSSPYPIMPEALILEDGTIGTNILMSGIHDDDYNFNFNGELGAINLSHTAWPNCSWRSELMEVVEPIPTFSSKYSIMPEVLLDGGMMGTNISMSSSIEGDNEHNNFDFNGGLGTINLSRTPPPHCSWRSELMEEIEPIPTLSWPYIQ